MLNNKSLLPFQVLALRGVIISFLLIVLIGLAAETRAQSISHFVIGNAGSYAEDMNIGSLHWTVGEIATTQFENGDILSEGFHQTYPGLLFTSIWELSDLDIQFEVFPNPTSNWLNIRTDQQEQLHFMLTTILGQTLLQKEFALTTQLDLSPFPAGIYLLRITRDGQFVKTFKIQKSTH